MLIEILVVLFVVGFLLYLTERVIPMDGTIRIIIRAVVIVALVLWLLHAFGLLPGGTALRFN